MSIAYNYLLFIYCIFILYLLYYASAFISYSEKYNSLIYLFIKYKNYVIAITILILALSFFYNNYIFIASLMFLIIYDTIFVMFILPLFKTIINLNIKDRVVNKNFLFCKEYEKDEREIYYLTYPSIVLDTQEVSSQKYSNRVFSYHKPLISYKYIEFNNLIKNFIWLNNFYDKQGDIKYYIYPFLSIAMHTLFFIVIYKFYFINIYHISNSLLVFLFLLIWLLYTLHSIEDILSLNYYKGYLNKLKKDPESRYFLKNLNIIYVKNYKSKRVEMRDFLNTLFLFSRHYDRKMEYMITFVATVIFIGLITFMGFYKPIEIKQKAIEVKVIKSENKNAKK